MAGRVWCLVGTEGGEPPREAEGSGEVSTGAGATATGVSGAIAATLLGDVFTRSGRDANGTDGGVGACPPKTDVEPGA